MAGHSKWANIKHRKAAQDAKRGKIFTRLIREITVSARAGGGEVESNPRLRLAVDKALGANMTRDTIDRAIKRGTGDLEGVNYEEITYEGYAPSGIAVLVECTTDNKNRTVAEVRHAFSKFGGNLGTSGSVAYLFNKMGEFFMAEGADEETVMDVALEAGADDIEADEGIIKITCPPEDYIALNEALTTADMKPESSEIVQRASLEVDITDADAEKVMKLIDALEELDDVQDVFSNAKFSDSFLEQQA